MTHVNMPYAMPSGVVPERLRDRDHDSVGCCPTISAGAGVGRVPCHHPVLRREDLDLGPLRVETDVLVADVDGDGRNDIVLLGGDDQCLVMFQSAPGMSLAPRAL